LIKPEALPARTARIGRASAVAAAPSHSGRTATLDHLTAVVIPTYNESENLPVLTERLFAQNIPNLRIIFVDDGSPDGTEQVAWELSEKYGGRIEVVQRGRKMGLGSAYVAGFRKALDEGADFVIQMDADLSHKPEYLPKFLASLEEADVVVGSRYARGGGVEEDWGLSRKILSGGGNVGIRAIAGLKVKDTTAGFKAFRAGVLRSFDLGQLRCKGFGFQAEVAHACQRLGYEVVEYPIIFANRYKGKSKMSTGIIVEAFWRLLPLRLSRKR